MTKLFDDLPDIPKVEPIITPVSWEYAALIERREARRRMIEDRSQVLELPDDFTTEAK